MSTDVYTLLVNLKRGVADPRPLLTHHQVEVVAYALIQEGVISQPECKHYWRRMKDLVKYSPSTLRYCADCGAVQVLTFNGWQDKYKLTGEVSDV